MELEITDKNVGVGSKVHYFTTLGGFENGIIKEVVGYINGIYFFRVVYNCNNDWDNYMNYTAALTSASHLKLGWK